LNENCLQTGSAPVLEGWNTVRISTNENNAIHCVIRRISGNVEADPHVDALLLEDWLKVCVGKSCGWSYGGSERPKSTELQYAAPDRE
jgi:hypothetical protein